MTRAEILAKLRDLLLGERTEDARVEAERLLVELGDDQKSPPTGRAWVVDEDAVERAKWARLVRRGGMSQRVWYPGRLSGHTKALERDAFSPWRR